MVLRYVKLLFFYKYVIKLKSNLLLLIWSRQVTANERQFELFLPHFKIGFSISPEIV